MSCSARIDPASVQAGSRGAGVLLQAGRDEYASSGIEWEVREVVEAPLQMRKEVALLRQQTGALDAHDLEPLLAAAASALPAGQIPTRIDYAEGALRLSGLTLTEAQRTALAPPLAARGLRASQQDGALVLQPAGATP